MYPGVWILVFIVIKCDICSDINFLYYARLLPKTNNKLSKSTFFYKKAQKFAFLIFFSKTETDAKIEISLQNIYQNWTEFLNVKPVSALDIVFYLFKFVM